MSCGQAEPPLHICPNLPLGQCTNCRFLGMRVVSGPARMRVVRTGGGPDFGRTSGSLPLRPPETGFEQGIRRFGNPHDPRPECLHFNGRIASGRFGDLATDQVVKPAGTPGMIADRHCERLRLVRAVEHHQDAVVAQSAQEHIHRIT